MDPNALKIYTQWFIFIWIIQEYIWNYIGNQQKIIECFFFDIF